MRWYLQAWKKCFAFSGRARRTEVWSFYMIYILVTVLISMTFKAIEPHEGSAAGILVGILALVFLVLLLVATVGLVAVSVRRIHDTGRSGLLVVAWLIPFVWVIWSLIPGTRGENRYGADPREQSA